MITGTEDKLFVLKNGRDDRTIEGNRVEKVVANKAKAISDATAKRDEALSQAQNMAEGRDKQKKLGIAETQSARLFNLNIPAANPATPQDVSEVAIEEGELDVLITYYQDVLDNLNLRKGELGGN